MVANVQTGVFAGINGKFNPAWHGLGINLLDGFTSDEACTYVGIDYPIVLKQLSVDSPYLGCARMLDHYAIIRDDTQEVFGYVTGDYHPLQNKEAFSILDGLVEDEKIQYESVVILGRGERVALLARIPECDFELGTNGVDKNETYMLLHTGHDGKSKVRILPTSVRVVCQNTLSLALSTGKGKGFAVKHSAKMHDRIAEGMRILKNSIQAFQKYAQQAKNLANETFLLNRMIELAEKVTIKMYSLDEIVENTEKESLKQRRAKETLQAMISNYDNERNSLPGIAGTKWAAFNAVTEYIDHNQKYRGDTRTRQENRFDNLILGKGDEIKEYALQYLLA